MASPTRVLANSSQPANHMPSVRAASEKKLGMLHYTSPANHGWHGDVRKRYTDFLVNEVRKDGKVLHLEDYAVAEQPTDANLHLPGQQSKQHGPETAANLEPLPKVVTEDETKALQDLLGETTTVKLKELYQLVIASGTTRLDPKANSVRFPPMEREIRGKVHQEIRRIFASRIETETNGEGVITAIPSNPRPARNPRNSRAGGRNQRSNQPSFKKLGGDYLHFTLYKENKDTMDAINQIGRIVKVKSNNFGFAGTKDRRAATVQRVSVFRLRHEILDFLNSQLPAVKMGDYKYSPYPIELGDHGGNEFKITVKNVVVTRGDCSLERRVQMTKQAVKIAVNEMVKYGFINYYGLQRFGTHIVGTHELGKLMLMENFEGVVDGILHVDEDFMTQVMQDQVQETPSNRDEINRARAIAQYKTSRNAQAALQTMPRRFAAEMNIIQHLEKKPRDFQGAILTITRGMRNLYLHAYQSYVWNHAASHRWAKYGSKVIPGDLVLATPGENSMDDVDEGLENSKASEESRFQRARILSEEEAHSGKYTIFDVVLPGPGFDVLYPNNDVGKFYVDFMSRPENGGLDPRRMRRSHKDFSVSGSYRHVLGQFKGEPKWEVRTYVDDNDQMRPTDLDLIEMRKAAETAEPQKATQAPENHTTTAEPTQPAFSVANNPERRRQRDSLEVEAVNGGSKRIKLMQVDSRPDTPESIDTKGPHEGGAPLWTDDERSSHRPEKPTRRPTVSNDLTSGATPTDVSMSEPAVDKSDQGTSTALSETLDTEGSGALSRAETAGGMDQPKTTQNSRLSRDACHAFTQADLSGYPDDQIKIAVILEFSLGTSAYATVVLRELMAEIEPEQPGSPLYPQGLSKEG